MASRNRYSLLRDAGKLSGTIARAMKLRRERDHRQALMLVPDDARTRIPFGPMMKRDIENKCTEMYPRRTRWTHAVATTCVLDRKVDVWTLEGGRFTRRGVHTTISYQPRIRSFGVCTNGRLCWYVGSQHEIWRVRRGWHFGYCAGSTNASERRMYVCQNKYSHTPSFRFYFSSDDLLAGDKLFWMRARDYVEATRDYFLRLKEMERITNTLVTVDIVVPHNGVRTVLRVSRKCRPPHNVADIVLRGRNRR